MSEGVESFRGVRHFQPTTGMCCSFRAGHRLFDWLDIINLATLAPYSIVYGE